MITGREPREWEFGGPAIRLLGDMLQRIRTPLVIVGDEAREIKSFRVGTRRLERQLRGGERIAQRGATAEARIEGATAQRRGAEE